MKSVRLARKLPLSYVVFSLFITTVLTVVSYMSFKSVIETREVERFRGVIAAREDSLQRWSSAIESDLASLAASRQTVTAIERLSAAWTALPGDPTQSLQRSYIANNPNPEGQLDLLNRAEGPEMYHATHEAFHPSFRAFQAAKGYYDLFLFDGEGNLVYSVFKERDFATNFTTGPFRDSGLGEAFLAARGAGPGEMRVADFAPYEPSFGQAAGFAATPVLDGTGQLVGVLAVQIPASQIAALMAQSTGLGETGDVFILGQDRAKRTPSRLDQNSSILDLYPSNAVVESAFEGENDVKVGAPNAKGVDVIMLAKPVNVGGLNWVIYAEKEMQELLAPVIAMEINMILISAALAVFFGIIGFLASRTVTQPLERIKASVELISDGDYDTPVSGLDRGDEIGMIAKALGTFQEKLAHADEADRAQAEMRRHQQDLVSKLDVALTHLARGDMTYRLPGPVHSDYQTLLQNYNASVSSLEATMSEFSTMSGSITQGSEEISQANNDLSHRTEDQAAALAQTAAALNQMTHGLKAAAEGTQSAEASAKQARAEAESSGQVMNEAVTAMSRIRKTSEEIEQMAGVIEGIAFQTNLLALNAGVEAARAGDSGRGFAVVASEVRSLAQRSSNSAKEVRDLLAVSSTEVARGVDLVEKAGEALLAIIERVESISYQVSDIATAASEQSTGLHEINTAVSHLDEVTQQNAAMVQECTAASLVLRSEASSLTEMLKAFKLKAAEKSAPVNSELANATPQREAFDAAVDDSFDPGPEDKGPMFKSVANGNSVEMWQDF